MARPRAAEAQRRAQRERIRRAASELYAAHGIGRVTIRGVAERAGVSQGTIYSYFTNGGALMRSLWIEPVAEASRELERIAADVEDPVERLRALLIAFVDFVLSNPDVHRGALLFVRPTAHPKPERQPLDDLVFYRLLVETLEALRGDGRLTVDDPRVAGELLWAAVHGALGLAINSDVYEVTPPQTLAGTMVDFLMQSVIVSS